MNSKRGKSNGPAAVDGSILPFPPTPSTSIAGPTMADSQYQKRVEPQRLSQGAPLDITIKANGKLMAKGQVPNGISLHFSGGNECFDIGRDTGSPVSPASFDKAPFPFNGKIETTTVRYSASVKKKQKLQRREDGTAIVEERFIVAMARE